MAQEELLALQKKLHKVTLPNFDGDVRIKHFGSVDYGFHRWGSKVAGPGLWVVSREEGKESPRMA